MQDDLILNITTLIGNSNTISLLDFITCVWNAILLTFCLCYELRFPALLICFLASMALIMNLLEEAILSFSFELSIFTL